MDSNRLLIMKTILGKIYVGDNENVIFVINDGVSQICLMNSECDCKVLVDDSGSGKPLNFNEHHQITGTYRLRRGCEKTIYFTDNYNPPRYLNLSDVNSFKEIVATSPLLEYGALDTDKLLLQKVYDKIPKVSLEIGGNGQLLSGSYNVAARYVDEDLNPSEWMQPTEPIMIWQSDATKFNEVRASSNEDIEYRKYGPTHKSIKASVRNVDCDHSYMFVQFALIAATTGTGIVNDVVYSPLIELNFNKSNGGEYDDVELTYNFTGGSDVSTGSEDEILANTEVFDRAKCIEQADNRLVMGNVTDMDIDWCKLQKYASRIVSDCVVKKVDLTDYSKADNPKNPMVLYNNGVGYQPGEIYSFGIVYVFENGAKSPVYHIPGRSSNENAGVPLCGGDLAMQQGNNKCSNMKYSEVAMACEGFKYWGCDDRGDELDGEYIRHHRFPYKQKSNYIDTEAEQDTRYIAHYNLIAGIVRGHSIRSRFRNNFDTIIVKYEVDMYTPNGGFQPNTNEEFEIDMQYTEEGFFNQIYKNLDISLKDTDLINFNPSPIAKNDAKKFYKNGLTIGEHTLYSNGWCSNPYSPTNGKLKNRKQHRYLDVYSFDVTDGNYAQITHLQEYPQFRENNSDIESRPVYMTTGSIIVYRNYGTPGGITGDNNKEVIHNEIADSMEALDDEFFKDMVKVLPDARYNNIYRDGRRVRLRFGTDKEQQIKDDINSDEEPSYELGYWAGKDKLNDVLINSSIGFYVEPRVEKVDTYKSKDKQEILGIKFDRIDIPDSKYLNGHKIIGYYFVQNERTAEDMTVLDSAILTPLFTENEIRSGQLYKMAVSGIIFADQNKPVPVEDKDVVLIHNLGIDNYIYYKPYETAEDSNIITDRIFESGVGFINPRFKFNKEELYNFRFRLLGYYTQQYGMVRYSSDFNEMWVTQDVQPGSSYNKKVNKARDKDDDGFDLHVYHRNSIVKYGMYDDNSPFGFNSIFHIGNEDIHYLVPSSSINKEFEGKTKEVFNASGDNNMGFMFNLKDSYGNKVNVRNLFVDDEAQHKISYIPYGYLERDLEDYYPDFGNRPYFIVSDFIPADNSKEIAVFRGDCYCSAFKYTTSMQYNIRMKKREKKETWWMYTLGALGVAGGVVGSIWTSGATMAVVGPSISLIQNGIRTDVALNTMKRFADMQGKNALTDGWAQIFLNNKNVDDDEIQWLCESVDGIFFESNLNINWRVGTTIPDITDYLNPLAGYNPSELRQYFQKKLTYADKEHKDGRMYRGFALAEIYDINKDFQRRNRQKMYYCIPITHKCCSECENSFPKRVVYSQQSFAEERTDNYKVFLPGNYTDIGGETGDITNVSYQGQDAFMVFTEEGLWQLAPSKQQNVNPVTQVVSFLGTGDFFNTPAQRIVKNDTNICFGSAHQTSFCNTPVGLFWYSEHDNAVYTFADKMPVDIFKQAGMGKFFEREGRLKTDLDWYKKYRTKYPFKDNPSSELGTGYVFGWDNKYSRLLITKKDNECSFMSECFYDSDQRQKDAVLEKVAELAEDNAYNICYKWNKERCCYMIDYDTKDSVISNVMYNDDGTIVEKAEMNTVLYIGNVEYYYDSLKKSGCGIADMVASIIGDSIKGNLLVVSNNATYDKISKYYDEKPMFYSTDDNSLVHNLYDFIKKEWSQYFANTDNYSYIAITGDESSFDVKNNPEITAKINALSKAHTHFNISVYPILKYKTQQFAYSTLADFMIAKGATFADYDNTLISDEYCYVLDKIELGEAKMYKNNVGEYREVLSSVKEEIDEIRRHIREDEFEVSMFDDVLSLISLYNTYNYWNLLKNAYDFVHYDTFGNGNKNLLMFKDTSDSFNAFALGYLGTDWYDENADYATLATNMANCTNMLTDAVDGIDTNAKMQTLVGDLFKELYDKYIDQLESEVYGGDNLTTMKNIAAMLSPNSSSIPFKSNDATIDSSDYAAIQAYVKTNVPLGDYVKTCVTVHNDIYLKDFVNNRQIVCLTQGVVLSEAMSGKDLSTKISKTISSLTGAIKTTAYIDHRIYLPNVEADIVDTDVNKLNDNSFTISYKPGVGFISFHSYMPSMYIGTPDALFTWRIGDNYVYRHNVVGSYQHFYGDAYPFVVEAVDKNSNIAFGPQVIDSISLLAQADQYVYGGFREMRDVFFTNVYFYNSRQCSLFSEISVKKAISDENYFDEYLGSDTVMDVIPAERRESLWHINKIRDFRVDYDNPIHLTDLDSRENFMYNHSMNGWIDKVINEDVVDINKNWWELEPFRDNFICQRYFYVPSSDDGIRLKVLLSTTTKAQSIDNTLK